MCQQWLSVAGLVLDVIGFLIIAFEWRHTYLHSMFLRETQVRTAASRGLGLVQMGLEALLLAPLVPFAKPAHPCSAISACAPRCNNRRSALLRAGLFGDLRLSTLICWRRTKISASRRALDWNSPMSAPQSNLSSWITNWR